MHRMKVIALILALGVGGCAATAQNDGLPQAAGVAVIRAQCLTCHEADLITSQRLSKAGWTRELDKMIRWGAVIRDAEREQVINYLTSSYGPRPFSRTPPVVAATSSPNTGSIERGRKLYETRCMNCHETDLTAQQRLSRSGWTREVEKMVRWGASVADNEKEKLVDFLATTYPVRPR